MTEWPKHRIAYLMSISFLLVVILAASWLYNTYQSDRRSLIRDATVQFSNAIRSLEDSIIQENLYVHLHRNPSDSIGASRGADTVRHITIRTDSRSLKNRRPPPMRFMRRRMLNRPSDEFAGSLAFLLGGLADTTRMARIQDTASLVVVRAVIQGELKKSMPTQELPYAYQLLVTQDTIETGQSTTKPYVDISTNNRFALALGNYEGALVKGMLPEILFTILLLSLVGFAFLLSHKTLERQRQMAQIKNELVGNITHELKTPIATVRVALEALQRFDAGTNPKKTEEYLSISQNELKRLEILVDNVLKTSMAEKDELNFTKKETDLRVLLEGILKTLHLQFEQANAKVNLFINGSDFYSEVDQTHLTGVIYNLLDNAVKYSQGDPIVEVSISSSENENIIEVLDRGMGIPPEYRMQVFDKFFRVPTHNIHNERGHGLGLNYVKRVVESHGGLVSFRNREEGGTVFQIKLPRV
ncbi:MAG: HAMP domain-containing histidine kinase [Saprospiraceae bacterium]|nr:HAMP domain-containing histidine kinase [Saprospiraceae bacterium]